MIIGIDVGGTNARALLIDPDSSEVIGRSRRSSAGSGSALSATLTEMVGELTESNDTTVESVGLGVAGLAHRSGVVHYSPNLPDLVEYPLGAELSTALGIEVTVMNDATAGTWAEAKLGAGRGCDDFILVALGTGIGTGFVSGGRLIHGAHGFAGEAGHMVVDASGPSHHTGHQGPWEYYASGSALGRMGQTQAASGHFPAALEIAGSAEDVDGFTVAAALAQGDDEARRIFAGFCRHVARGLVNLALIFDPARIVIGGGLTTMGEPLRSGVETGYRELMLGASHRPPIDIVMAQLGDDAGALGAALWAHEGL